MLVGFVGQFEQGQGQIGGNGQVKFGLAEGRHDDRTVADTARDLLSTNIQLGVQSVNWQRAIVGILDVEPNCESLLQQIPAS